MKRVVVILQVLFVFHYFSVAQNVGIGTTSPQGILHLKGTNWVKSIFENNTGEARGYIGSDNNGTITLASNAYWNGSTWVYPNSGSSMYLLLHRANNQFEFRVRPDGGVQSTPMVIEVGGNVGVGTASPQQNLSVGGGAVIDQNNTNTGTLNSSLLFGSNSTEGIGSRRSAGGNINGLDFFTGNTSRFNISNLGNIGINTGGNTAKSRLTIYHQGNLNIPADQEEGHAVTLMDSSYFSVGEPKMTLNMGIQNSNAFAYIMVKKSTTTGNTPKLRLNPYGDGAVIIGGGGYFGTLNEKFIVGYNVTSLFENDVKFNNNITVQNGKGIIRNTTATQLKQVVSSVTVNTGSIGAGITYTQNITWNEIFSGIPAAAYIGNITGGAGGWAELVMTISNVSSTGCTLYLFNPRLSAVNPSFTFNVIAVGPQ